MTELWRPGQAALPVGTLKVEVVEGPDAGRSHEAGSESLSVGTADGNDLVLGDRTVSRFHLELRRRDDGVLVRDCGSTNGTRVGALRVERAVVPPGTVVHVGATTLRVGEGPRGTVPLHDGDALLGLRGRSAAMRRLMEQLTRAARTDAAVHVVGESGTGKELIARALHELGPRAGRPFVTVDCGALAPTLVASELFGHEKGAFTGADRQRAGAFEAAHGGTIFLDEIGELSPPLQATLLGVLERRRFRRLGGQKDLAVDVRLVTATHRDLRAEVNAGTFRLDLYYRLAVVVLAVPALRERAEDVPLLVEHFLRELGHDGPIEELISTATMRSLAQHYWPGNVRELRNLVEATMAMGEAPSLEPATPIAGGDPFGPLLGRSYKEARTELLAAFEKRYLPALLERAGGNVSRAAREARMDRSYLIELLERHGLKPRS
jgi:DNA-binding NtrC family response regulator